MPPTLPTYEPISALVQIALAGITGGDWGVMVDVNDTTQAPTGSTKKYAMADMRTALLKGGAGSGYAVTDTLSVQGATITSGALSINGLAYNFPAAQTANGFLKTDGAGNLTWVAEGSGISLAGLSDVALAGLSNGQSLVYNSVTSKWNNSYTTTVTGGGVQAEIVMSRDVTATPTITSIPLLAKNYGFYVIGAGDTNGNDNSPAGIGLVTFDMGSTSTRGSAINFASSRSTATQFNAGTFTPVQANDQLGAIFFGGDNGVNLRNLGVLIAGFAGTAWTSANAEGYLQFQTTPNGATVPVLRWSILSAGHFIAGADNAYDFGTSSTRARSAYIGTSVVIGTDPTGAQLLRVGGDAIFSDGLDASTTFSVGAGGAAPSGTRSADLILNAPNQVSTPGRSRVRFQVASADIWRAGLLNSVVGTMTALTDFVWDPGTGTPTASITAAGQIRSAVGHVTKAGAAGTFGSVDAFGVNFVVNGGIIAGFDTAFNFNFNGAPATGNAPAINVRSQSGNGTAFGLYMDQINTGTVAGVGHKFALADSASAMVTAGTIEFGKTNTWTSGSNATYMSHFVLKVLASNVLTTYFVADANTGNSTFFSPLLISGATFSMTGAATNSNAFGIATTLSTVAGSGRGIFIFPTFVATANSDVLTGISVAPGFTPGAFTGLAVIGLNLAAFSVAGFTSPADPIQLSIGSITGTGATNAYSIKLGTGPTGATNNYLIHATNFQLTAAGGMTLAAGLTFGTSLLSTTALATPGAFVATTAAHFASTVSGAAIMGFGTTYDVSFLQKSGAVAAGVPTGTTNFIVVGGFGCNGSAAQTPVASGGALAAYVTGAFGLDSSAHMQALFNLVVAIRAALVANGQMS